MLPLYLHSYIFTVTEYYLCTKHSVKVYFVKQDKKKNILSKCRLIFQDQVDLSTYSFMFFLSTFLTCSTCSSCP